MLDNGKMFKLLSTQSLVSMTEPSDAFGGGKPHPSSTHPFLPACYYRHFQIYREPCSEHQYARHTDSTIANTLLFFPLMHPSPVHPSCYLISDAF